MVQSSYSVDPAVGFRGLLADPNGDAFAIPLANGAAAAQGFGIMVKRDAANLRDQFDIFSAAGQVPLGVLIHTHEQQDPTLAGDLGISLLEIASVLRRGRIWVRVEEAITVGDSVYFRHTTGTGTEIGAFRNDADGEAEVTTATPTVVEDDIYGLDIQAGGVPYHFEAVADGDVGAAQVTTATPTVVEDDIYGLDIQAGGVPYHFEAVADGDVGAAQVTTATPTIVEDDIYGLDLDVAGVPYHFEAVADGDVGDAQVTTLTPTVTNSVVYGLQVLVQGHLYRYNFTSDGSAADTEIVTGLRALIDADAEFSALVVSTGTTTIILTGQVAGMRFDVVEAGDGTEAGVMTSITETTAPGVSTPTLLCDKFRTLMAANAPFTAAVVATGTATLILTGQTAGQLFHAIDAGHGAWASITETTPAGVATATTLLDKFRALMAANAPFTAAVVATGTATLILTGQTAGQLFHVISAGHGAWASITETVAAGVATATTLLDKFRALMAADAAFTALIVATGTATLILTGQVAGSGFLVTDAGHGAWASITEGVASAPTCDQITNAQWLEGSSAAGIALLELNIP